MIRSIEFSRDAVRILRQIDRTTSDRIRAKVDQLASNPAALANNVTALKGGEGLLRLRVGEWRVIYRDGIVLHIVRVAPRGSAYE